VLYCTKNRRNPVREYYENLIWDGVPRIKSFMSDAYGSPRTAYTMEVSKNFFLAIVARVLKPGCKFDQMIVLEGKHGPGYA
jgi:predicted P-loop ATPase